ncbi:MAG: CBS domain-containing protein [Hyphomicrobium sp.]|jgi:CBS domain-containing protein
MATVREVLRQKGHVVHWIEPGASVRDAVRVMAERNIGALLVMEDGQLAGIITERDYARKVVLKGRTSASTLVREIMATRLVVVCPDQKVEECMAVMTARAIRHLPVVENGDVVGIVSIGDMVKSIIADQKFIIEQLEHYIHGVR